MGALPEDKSWFIGFRVALGDMPRTSPLPATGTVRHQQNVRQDVPPGVFTPPDPARPYFEGPKQFVKIEPDSTGPLFSWHNHHTAIAECPNGDLLALWFTTETESGREMGVAASRLRFGEREWDTASPFWDAPDRNDTGPALWYDGERTLYHFNGLSTAGTWGPLAVIMRTSVDNGVTWSKTRLILPEHRSRHQVVQSVFRTREGWLVLPCDATPSGSGGTAIHISKDNGNTWADAGGTIAGIHAAVAQLRDGRLLAFGRGDEMGDQDSPFQFPGSNRSNPQEYRPATQSISADMGRTWTYTPGTFQPISGGQRLVLLRLQEGPLLAVSFANETDEGRPVPPVKFTDASGRLREGRGLFAALSYDDGRNWAKVRLVTDDGPAREVKTTNGRSTFKLSPESAEPKGYLSVCQARNGVIHLLSSWNHYAFNLKWIEAAPPAVASN